MFANISSRCMTCGKAQRKGGIPDAGETRKVREALTATNPRPSNQRRSAQATGARQGTSVLEDRRECLDFGGGQAAPRIGSRGPLRSSRPDGEAHRSSPSDPQKGRSSTHIVESRVETPRPRLPTGTPNL